MCDLVVWSWSLPSYFLRQQSSLIFISSLHPGVNINKNQHLLSVKMWLGLSGMDKEVKFVLSQIAPKTLKSSPSLNWTQVALLLILNAINLLRTVACFATAHTCTFCTSLDGLRSSDFLRIVPVPIQTHFCGFWLCRKTEDLSNGYWNP